jgi:hypothetical protein
MLTVSQRFLTALRQSHAISVAATIYAPSDLATPIEVRVVSGDLTVDQDAQVTRQASLEIAFTLVDDTVREAVAELPYGGYATVERGITYADGAAERVQLGRFRVDSVVWDEQQRTATLTLNDRMAQIIDERFVTPYAPAGVHPSDAAVQVAQQVFGSTIAYHVLTTPASEPLLSGATVYEEDRAAALADLASSVGAEALFDNLGDFVIRPRTPSTAVAWVFDAGDNGSLIQVSETVDRSSVRNGVSVRGQPDVDQPPIYALATYDDPTAPTRWGGPFGKVPLISSSTAVASQAQADATARSLLNLRLGLSRTLVLQGIPNPALEPGDLIEIRYPDGRTEQQLVNAIRLGLDVTGALELTTTSQVDSTP